MPALRIGRAHQQNEGQGDPHRALQVLRVPPAIQLQGRHHLREEPHPAQDMAASHAFDRWQQEGHVREPAPPHLGITLKRAWFLGHRIREAMRSGRAVPPMGSAGGIVEVDDTRFGRKKGRVQAPRLRCRHARHHDLDRPQDRREPHLPRQGFEGQNPRADHRANIAREAQIASDEAHRYTVIGLDFARHESVRHAPPGCEPRRSDRSPCSRRTCARPARCRRASGPPACGPAPSRRDSPTAVRLRCSTRPQA